MEQWNNDSYNKKNINLDKLLRQALDCSEKPDEHTQAQLMSMLKVTKASNKQNRLSLWWLPAMMGTILTAACLIPTAFLLHGSILGAVMCFVEAIFCINSWILTFVGLTKFNFREAALL